MCPPMLTERVIDCSGGDTISEESSLQHKRKNSPLSTYSVLEARTKANAACRGPRLHMRPPTLTERVIDCSGGDTISEESGLQRGLEELTPAHSFQLLRLSSRIGLHAGVPGCTCARQR